MLNRKFGVELEFGLHFDPKKWQRIIGNPVCDPDLLRDYLCGPRRVSARTRKLLRNGEFSNDGSGVEFATPILTWKDWPVFVRVLRVLGQLPTYTGTHDGLHVHHDVSTASKDEIFNLLRFWMRHQPTLYNLVSAGRRRGWAARPISPTMARNILRGWNMSPEEYFETHYREYDDGTRGSARQQQFNALINRCDRYCGLNLLAIRRYGSVEFRLHEGTLDPVKIRRWVRFTQAFVERGLEYTGPLTRATADDLVQEVGRSAFTGGLLTRLHRR